MRTLTTPPVDAGPFTLRGRAGRFVFWLLTAAAALAAANRLSDPDLWLHLAGGKLVLEEGLPRLNTFSFTWPHYPWRFTQWLFGVLLALIERGPGLEWIELLQILLTALAFGLTLDTIRRRAGGLDPLLIAPLLLLALTASQTRFVPRPHLVTYAGLALLLNLRQRGARRLPLWYGLAGVVWGNCHAGVAFGLGLAFMMALAEALVRDREGFRRALAACGALFAGSLVNPNGFYPYLYSFRHLSLDRVIAIEEFRSPSLESSPAFYLLAGLALCALPSRLRRRDFLYVLSVPVFATLALFSMRLIPKFALVTLPGLAVTLHETWAWGASRAGRRFLVSTALTALTLLGIRSASVQLRRARHQFALGWGVNHRVIPEGAAQFIIDKDLRGRMYNDFAQGGYLAWKLYPGQRVFVDGRIPAYPPAFFRTFLAGGAGHEAWPRLMDDYRIDFAVVERRPYISLDFSLFFKQMGWPLVYLDGVSYIFVRPGSPDDAWYAPDLFRFVTPWDSAQDLRSKALREPAAVSAELRRLNPERFIEVDDFLRFGGAALAVADHDLAERFFRQGLGIVPDEPVFHLQLGLILLGRGASEEARRELELASRLGAGTPVGERANKGLADPALAF